MIMKKLLGGLAIASLLAMGVGVGVVANTNNAVEAKASSQGTVISKGQARIWIGYGLTTPFYQYADPNTSDPNSSGLNGGIKLWAHANETGGEEKVYNIAGNFNNVSQGNRRYSYFDVDSSIFENEWYVNIQKFQDGNWKASTNAFKLSAESAFKVLYTSDSWAWDKTQSDLVAGAVDSVDAGLAAKALGGMLTCSSSDINGYNAFPNYVSTFISNDRLSSWKVNGVLNEQTLDDYADGDETYSGSSSATERNAQDKFDEIRAKYNASNPLTPFPTSAGFITSPTAENNTPIIVTCVAVVSFVAAGGSSFIFLRKRRMN